MPITAADIYQFLIALHLIGLTFGLGGATISDITFFGELRLKGRIEAETVKRMHSFTQLVWVGLALLGASGIGLLVVTNGAAISIPGFLAKMVIVAIVIANGVFLTFYVTPRLTSFNFSDNYARGSRAWKTRKLTFMAGAISATSWYGAFFVAMFKSIVQLSFVEYIGAYLAVLAFAVLVALAMEGLLAHRTNRSIAHAVNSPFAAPLHSQSAASTTNNTTAFADVNASNENPIPQPAQIITPTVVRPDASQAIVPSSSVNQPDHTTASRVE